MNKDRGGEEKNEPGYCVDRKYWSCGKDGQKSIERERVVISYLFFVHSHFYTSIALVQLNHPHPFPRIVAAAS